MKKTLTLFLFTVFSNFAIGDPAAVHGMLLFGNNKIYVSHLPMFHSPHDCQVLLEVGLEPEAKKLFLADQTTHPDQRIYTLVPERFVLPEMVQRPKPFKATLVRGHFERGGTDILVGTQVSIQKVVYFSKLNPKANPPAALQYILFGIPGETFLAHFISGRPNFDQVLGAEVKNIKLGKLIETKPFVLVQIPRLVDDKPVSELTPVIAQVPGDDETRDILVTLKELYLEFDDLK